MLTSRTRPNIFKPRPDTLLSPASQIVRGIKVEYGRVFTHQSTVVYPQVLVSILVARRSLTLDKGDEDSLVLVGRLNLWSVITERQELETPHLLKPSRNHRTSIIGPSPEERGKEFSRDERRLADCSFINWSCKNDRFSFHFSQQQR